MSTATKDKQKLKLLDGVDAFWVYKFGTNFRDLGGCYVMMGRNSANRWVIRYAGQTKSLEDRLTTNLEDHHAYGCAVGNGATHIAVLVVPNKNKRLEIEQELIEVYDPPCNGKK